MSKAIVVFAFLLVAGCTTERTYTVDLTRLDGFEWDGRIQVHTRDRGMFVGFQVDRVIVRGRDERTVQLDLEDPDRGPAVELYEGRDDRSSDEVVVEKSHVWRPDSKLVLRVPYLQVPGRRRPAGPTPTTQSDE